MRYCKMQSINDGLDEKLLFSEECRDDVVLRECEVDFGANRPMISYKYLMRV